MRIIMLSPQTETDLNKATLRFQRANSLYQAAKETVALAEERMVTCSKEEMPEFDSAWQEMMNHATLRVSDDITFYCEVFQEISISITISTVWKCNLQ